MLEISMDLWMVLFFRYHVNISIVHGLVHMEMRDSADSSNIITDKEIYIDEFIMTDSKYNLGDENELQTTEQIDAYKKEAKMLPQGLLGTIHWNTSAWEEAHGTTLAQFGTIWEPD